MRNKTLFVRCVVFIVIVLAFFVPKAVQLQRDVDELNAKRTAEIVEILK